jgi:hypothetical protein
MAESGNQEKKNLKAKSMQQQYTDKSEGEGTDREDELDNLPSMKKVSSTVDKGVRNKGAKKGLEFESLNLNSDFFENRDKLSKSNTSFPLAFNKYMSGSGVQMSPPMGKKFVLQIEYNYPSSKILFHFLKAHISPSSAYKITIRSI